MDGQIKKVALENGFKLKAQSNGTLDLNPYVYDFAKALLKDKDERIAELEKELEFFYEEAMNLTASK